MLDKVLWTPGRLQPVAVPNVPMPAFNLRRPGPSLPPQVSSAMLRTAAYQEEVVTQVCTVY